MNGIFEIELGGQLRQLRFNNYARAELGNVFGLDPLEAGQKAAEMFASNYMLAIAYVVFAGLTGAVYATFGTRDFTREQVAEWVGEANVSDLVTAFNMWRQSNEPRELIESNSDDANATQSTVTAKKK
ncbi:hypothetical protein DCC81_24785 [Chitinophaga parva]|uniref:Uncharacterized protein n=1 Tax=Chitinophaga parva TaxID=2169414 RepID=A0A2T7BBQ6_9BACT|nr:hypothetical protein [Chitinophaga parva]PUZ21807.1 hypothetical protein DCC81_24785 [Chitinophaga parva]